MHRHCTNRESDALTPLSLFDSVFGYPCKTGARMHRTTVSIEDHQWQWVEQQAETRGVERAVVIRDCIDDAMTDDEVMQRLIALESRIDTLEQALTVRGPDAGDGSDAVLDEPDGLDGVDVDGVLTAAASRDRQWTQHVDERRQAGRTALAELARGWTGTGGDIVTRVRERGAGVESQQEDDSFWRHTLKPVLDEARERDVVTKNPGTHVWRWVG